MDSHAPLFLGIHEPAVALTDLALAGIAGWLGWRLWRASGPNGALRGWLAALFATVAAASILGGLDHGFFRDPPGLAHDLVWPLTLIALGGSSLALAAIAAHLALSERFARRAAMVAALLFLWYVAKIALGERAFEFAVNAYLPSTLLLLAVLIWRWLRDRLPGAGLVIAGLALTVIAAAQRQAGIAIDPVWFDNNALYHL
ncbi:MAG: DUF6962 family protein, partial [Thermomicrobiales bacterium]